MSEALPTLFVDRDGTLIEEPPDEQVDSLEKIRFLPGVFAALQRLSRAGFRLVMVTNQDGLGTASFPQVDFELARISFCAPSLRRVSSSTPCSSVRIARDNCDCRKPRPDCCAASWPSIPSTRRAVP